MAKDYSDGAAVFPAGMTLRLDKDGAVVGNQGDVIIAGDLSESLGKIKQVFSEQGSVEVSTKNFKVGTIEAAQGDVVIHGSIKARKITGKNVRATAGTTISKVIIADNEIELSGKSIKVELVVAPNVQFGADTKGRATAVECDNEIGASKVRGRLSLEDYVDIVAGAKAVLEENDIPVPETDDEEEDEDDESLGGAAEDMAADPEELATAPPDEEELGLDDDAAAEDLASEDSQPAGADLPSMEMGALPAGDSDEEELSEDELAEINAQLLRSLGKIDDAYADAELPPPVVFLKSLVNERRFDYIKTQINSIWSDLLKYHQKKGLYISNAVTHQFQQIQIAMRKLPEG